MPVPICSWVILKPLGIIVTTSPRSNNMAMMTAIEIQGFRRVELELFFSLMTKTSFNFETITPRVRGPECDGALWKHSEAVPQRNSAF